MDDEDPDKRRHLLRLWLRAHNPRPLVENISALASPGCQTEGEPVFTMGSLSTKSTG